MVSATTAMRAWLAFLAVFELPMIIKHGANDHPLGDGFGSNLFDGSSERRLWAFMLVLLVLPRITAAVAYESKAVRLQCAAVHTAEAAYFTLEHRAKPTTAQPIVFWIVYLNALIFIAWALSTPSTPAPSEAPTKKNKGS